MVHENRQRFVRIDVTAQVNDVGEWILVTGIVWV